MKFYSAAPQQGAQQTGQPYKLDTENFCIEADPVDRKNYWASAKTASLGALALARICTNSVVITRRNEEFMDPAFKRFSLVYAIEGDLMISHHLGTCSLKAGDFILMDNSHPRKMLVNDRVSLFLASIPHQVLKRYIPGPEVYVGMAMPAASAVLSGEELAFAPLLAMWEKLKNGNLREFAPSLSDKFLSLVARMYASQLNNRLYQHSSISSIAFQFGFRSAAHFSRAFHKQFGYRPRDFRKHNRQVQSHR